MSVVGDGPDGGTWRGNMMEQSSWLGKVSAEMASNDILIYVHGFNTSQSGMLRRSAKIQAGVKKHGFRGAFVAYDWPSDGKLTKYASDRNDAKKTAPALVADGIAPLLGLPSRPKVHIIAHSMGTYLVLRAFSDFGDSIGPGNASWSTDQVMFVSGDVDKKWMEKGAWGGLVMKERSNRFTNYYSQLDEILNLSGSFIHGGPRAGREGLPPLLHAKQVDVYCNEQYKRDVPSNERTAVYSHRWWFDNDGFYKDIAQTIAGKDENAMNTRRTTNLSDLALLT
jgi:esterase/lipase superfamily enzyme